MSHFSVLVIGKDISKQLQPYHEYECTDEDDKYVIDVDCTKEVEKHLEETLFVGKDIRRSDCDELNYEYSKDKAKITFGEAYKEMTRRNYIKEKGESEDEEIKDYFGYKKKRNKWFNHTNPNAKWDWWVIGGRWAGELKLKEGKKGQIGEMSTFAKMDKESRKEYLESIKTGCDSAKKGDVNFTPIKKEIERAKRFWELKIEKQEPLNDDEKEFIKFDFYKDEYYLKRFKTKKEYIKRTTEFNTFAVVKDGKWYEKGEMGWFGCSSDTHEDAEKWEKGFMEKWINDLGDDVQLTIVDCHI